MHFFLSLEPFSSCPRMTYSTVSLTLMSRHSSRSLLRILDSPGSLPDNLCPSAVSPSSERLAKSNVVVRNIRFSVLVVNVLRDLETKVLEDFARICFSR